MKKKFSPEQEETSVKEQTEPEPESDLMIESQANGHLILMNHKMYRQLNHKNQMMNQ